MPTKEALNKQIREAQDQLNQAEKTELLARQKELNTNLEWLQTNKLQDIGQVEAKLSQINERLRLINLTK